MARLRAHPGTGLLPHAAWRADPRGSSAALMIPFIYEIDPAFALAQYTVLEQHFATRFFGVLPALREYPDGVDGRGDVDSGPLVFGVSAPASVVGIAAAQITGRTQTAADLRATPELLGFPVTWGGRRSYGFRQLPVGDAFLAWATSARPWNQPWEGSEAPSPFRGCRWVWSLGWGTLLVVALWKVWHAQTRPEVG